MPKYKKAPESEEDYSSDEQNSDEEELAALLAIEKEKKMARRAAAGDEAEEDGEEEEEAIYNVDAMHDKLEDIAWTGEQPWAETLAITSDAPTQVDDVDDDLGRELAFYNQALAAAKTAIVRFEEAGVPWRRPVDYFAEMVKSDDHMARVKEQLLYEQQVIEGAEQRRREREAKKISKQVQAERKKERDHEKKKAITGVSALRKQRERSGFAGDLDMEAELARMEGRGGAGGPGAKKAKLGERFAAKDKSAKRVKRDAKYGFGGPKRLSKQNDAYSAAAGDYKPSRGGGGGGRGGRGGRGGGGRGGGGRGGGGGKAQRPGKARRAAMKR